MSKYSNQPYAFLLELAGYGVDIKVGASSQNFIMNMPYPTLFNVELFVHLDHALQAIKDSSSRAEALISSIVHDGRLPGKWHTGAELHLTKQGIELDINFVAKLTAAKAEQIQQEIASVYNDAIECHRSPQILAISRALNVDVARRFRSGLGLTDVAMGHRQWTDFIPAYLPLPIAERAVEKINILLASAEINFVAKTDHVHTDYRQHRFYQVVLESKFSDTEDLAVPVLNRVDLKPTFDWAFASAAREACNVEQKPSFIVQAFDAAKNFFKLQL